MFLKRATNLDGKYHPLTSAICTEDTWDQVLFNKQLLEELLSDVLLGCLDNWKTTVFLSPLPGSSWRAFIRTKVFHARPRPPAYSSGSSGITVSHIKRHCKRPPPEEHPTAFRSRETHHTAENGEGDTLENKQKAPMRSGLYTFGSNNPLTHAHVVVIHHLPCSWKGDQLTAEPVLHRKRQVHK